MDIVVLNIIVALVGSFIALLLMVNAFFTRQTLKEITEVKLKLTELIVKHDATEERSKFNYRELEKTRERLHKVESDTRQLFELYKELTKE